RHDGSRLFRGGERTDGAKQGERLEIDRDDRDAGRLARLDVAVDRVSVRSGQDDAAMRLPGLVDGLRDDVVVEHRVCLRDRERLVRAEADRVLELAPVLDAFELE